jgi:hypothetical protein
LLALVSAAAGGCGFSPTVDGPKLTAKTETLTTPEGVEHRLTTLTADAGENNEGFESEVTDRGVTINSEGSFQALNFTRLIWFGWLQLLAGLILGAAMLKFPILFGDAIPNSLPASAVLFGCVFAFGSDYAGMVTEYVLMLGVVLIQIGICVPGFWNNVMRLKDQGIRLTPRPVEPEPTVPRRAGR